MRTPPALMALVLGGLVLGCSSTSTQISPAAWNSLNSGMTRQEIIGMLGQPSGRTGSGEDTWRNGKWELRVGYDQRGQAIRIVRQMTM